MLRAVRQALAVCDPPAEILPLDVRQKFGILDAERAYSAIHEPANLTEAEMAKKRLIFEEFFIFSAGLSLMRAARAEKKTAAYADTDLAEFYAMAQTGTPVSISSMCTVFAESEVIGHIGAGKPRADIAAGVIDSVASRVSNLVTRFGIQGELHLTGGLCDSPYFLEILSQKTNRTVTTHPMARYAGALGAALAAGKQKTIDWSTYD
jgi:sugar (pentulose or hexulose) kinase